MKRAAVYLENSRHSLEQVMSMAFSIMALSGIPPVVTSIGLRYILMFSFSKFATPTWRRTVLVAVAIMWTHSLPAVVVSDFAPLFTRIKSAEWIPAKLNDRWLFVDVMINRRGPFHMLLDTGCSASVISPEVAAAVEAKPNGVPLSVFNGFGSASEMAQITLDSIQIGATRFEGVPAGVTSFDAFSQIEGERIDGALGFSLFFDVVLSMDFPHQRIGLSSAHMPNIGPVRAEVPMREKLGVPFVEVELQGRRLQLEIDTGSNAGLRLSPELAQSLAWKAEPRPGSLVMVLGEGQREWTGRLAGALNVGSVRQNEPLASISDGGASLGVNFLKGFCVEFDQANDRMSLCAASSTMVSAPAERTVGLNLLAAPNGWRVVGVIPGSPAEEAHISPEEIVTKIEGEPAHTWSRDRLQAWIDAHDALAVELTGTGGVRAMRLRVWSLVP